MPQKSLSAGAPARFAQALCGAAILTGCGGGVPLLHPAHTLASGVVTAGAGVSGQFLLKESGGPRPPRGAPASEVANHDFVERLAKEASFSPGVAPWVGARVGISGSNEGGLTYFGRSLRVDGRHAFGDKTWALSVGAGASAVLTHSGDVQPPTPDGTPTPATDEHFNPAGWGLDVPVLVGYRSTASVVQLWAGVRGGVERLTGELPLCCSRLQESPPSQNDVSVTRWYGGGLIGTAIGFRPFWVALELDVAYQFASGRTDVEAGPNSRNVEVKGVTLAPSGAIIGKF